MTVVKIYNIVSLNSQLCETSYLCSENTARPYRYLDGLFHFRSTQPVIFASDYIETNQLQEVIYKMVYVYKFHLSIIILKVIALLAATIDMNQIIGKVAKVSAEVYDTLKEFVGHGEN